MLFRLFPLVALAATAAACSQSTPEQASRTPTEVAAQRRKATQEFRLDCSAPEPVDSLSAYQYQYVGFTSKEVRSSSYGSSYESDYQASVNFNIAFFQPDGTDAHLLLPHSRFRIGDFDAKLLPAARAPYLFYNITTADLTHDGRQDGNDPSTLFASDRQGRHLRQVTPDSADVLSWQVMKPHYLVVQLRPDSNHDGSYTNHDATQWLRYDLQNLSAAPAPLLPPPMLQILQRQLIDRRLQLPNEE